MALKKYLNQKLYINTSFKKIYKKNIYIIKILNFKKS